MFSRQGKSCHIGDLIGGNFHPWIMNQSKLAFCAAQINVVLEFALP